MKTAAMSNFIAMFAIAFGLIASFGGIDLASLGAVFMLLAIFPALKNSKLSFLIIKRKFAILALLTCYILYFLGGIFVNKAPISEGVKHIIAIIVLLPFGIVAMHLGNQKNKIARAIIAGFCILMAVLIFDAIGNYSMYQMANPSQVPKSLEVNLGRGAFIALALFWVAMLASVELEISSRVRIFGFFATLFISTRFGMDLHIIIFLCASIAAMLSRTFPKLITGIVMFVPMFLIGLAPIIYSKAATIAKNTIGDNLPMSWGRRADMWLYAHDRILEKPIWGWGFDGSRKFDEIVKYAGYEWGAIQMHPHSAPLHIWMEGGAIGAALAIIFIYSCGLFLLNSSLSNKKNAWALNGMLTSIIIGWCWSYSVWEQWLWALVFFLIGFIALVANKSNSRQLNSHEGHNNLSEL